VALTGHSTKELLAEQQRDWQPAFVGLGQRRLYVPVSSRPPHTLTVQIVVNGHRRRGWARATLAAFACR